MAQVSALVAQNRAFDAMKLYRDQSGAGLFEAKPSSTGCNSRGTELADWSVQPLVGGL
jgi:hypothetical protein